MVKTVTTQGAVRILGNCKISAEICQIKEKLLFYKCLVTDCRHFCFRKMIVFERRAGLF